MGGNRAGEGDQDEGGGRGQERTCCVTRSSGSGCCRRVKHVDGCWIEQQDGGREELGVALDDRHSSMLARWASNRHSDLLRVSAGIGTHVIKLGL